MSQRMYIDNTYIFAEGQLSDEIKQPIWETGDFFNGQPERFIFDDPFWEDLKEVAYQNGELDCMAIFTGHTEWDRNFMLIVSYGQKDFYFHSFWWQGGVNFDLQSIADVGRISESRDFYVGFGKEGFGFNGGEEMFNFLEDQYELERNSISELFLEQGGTLTRPLHYERSIGLFV